MLFPSTDFAIFICIVFATGWLLDPGARRTNRLPWKLFMLAASYVFYAWWDPALVWLLATVTILAQVSALAISRARDGGGGRIVLAGAVGLVLLPLLWFKYYGWIALTAAEVSGLAGMGPPLPLMQILLPVGISFYTFMAISYVIDVWRKECKVAGWLDVFLYLSFFPHLVAGPIVRPNELIPQFDQPRDPGTIDTGHAARLIFRGLFKKIVVSSYLTSAIVDPVFADPSSQASLDVLFAIYGYAIVIYSDFSGYTDIAIGVAELLGFRFPINFDAPYTAVSLQDFWRRWHVTLSRWLRDYLYIPLGGSRAGEPNLYRNIMLTMLLGGLWHGAGWTFLVWGAIHGFGQVMGHYRRSRFPGTEDGRSPVVVLRRRVVTFHAVCLAWVFFRAESLSGAIAILQSLTSGLTRPASLTSPLVVLVIVAAIAAQYLRSIPPVAAWSAGSWERFARLDPVSRGAVAAVILFVITTLGPEGVAPFIYFRF